MASLLKFTKYVGSFSRSYLQQTACRSLSTTQKLRLDTRDNYDGYIQDKIQEGKVAVEDEPEQIQVPDHLGFTMDNAHQYLLAEEFHPEADEVLDMQVDQIWDMPIDHGTRDRPILVPSRADHRVIGCISAKKLAYTTKPVPAPGTPEDGDIVTTKDGDSDVVTTKDKDRDFDIILELPRESAVSDIQLETLEQEYSNEYLGEVLDVHRDVVVKRGEGTVEFPCLIPSKEESRMIGCLCEEEEGEPFWMLIEEGIAKRCHCGYYFKLERISEPDKNIWEDELKEIELRRGRWRKLDQEVKSKLLKG